MAEDEKADLWRQLAGWRCGVADQHEAETRLKTEWEQDRINQPINNAYNPDTTFTMPLLNFANDLLYCIADNIESNRDLNAFARCNRRLYHLLNSSLYRHAIQRTEGSALLWAAKHGQEATVQKLLLGERADQQATRHRYYSGPLCVAAEKGHEGIVKLLLDKRVNVNAWGLGYGNALHAASWNGYERIVQLLLDNGAKINAPSRNHGSALEEALASGHEHIVQLLINNGANPNTPGGQWGNALYAASAEGNERIVKLLLDNGAKVNAMGGYHGNALQAASVGGHEQVVKLLLDNGANVNA